MNTKLLAAAGLVATLGMTASAGFEPVNPEFAAFSSGVDFDFMEQNDALNDDFSTADLAGMLTMSDPDLVGSGQVSAGDVDWYQFSLGSDASLQFATGATLDTPYGLSLQMLDADGNVLVGDAEIGPGDSSPLSIQQALLPQGTYYIGISGYDPDVLNGDLLDGSVNGMAHNFDFNYVLSLEATPISVIPLPPAALAGLSMMLPLGVYRRMKKRA